jgi:hypothetical protein
MPSGPASQKRAAGARLGKNGRTPLRRGGREAARRPCEAHLERLLHFFVVIKLRYTQKLSRTNGRAKAQALIPWVKCVITGEASCEKEMPFQAAPFVLGTAGATAVGAGAWHVLTGNSCDSWRTCAGSRKHTMLPERTGSEIAASLYHPTGPGHGNVQGDGTHTGQLSLPSPGGGARPQAPAPAPRACPLSSLSCCADRRCGRAQAFRRGWST